MQVYYKTQTRIYYCLLEYTNSRDPTMGTSYRYVWYDPKSRWWCGGFKYVFICFYFHPDPWKISSYPPWELTISPKKMHFWRWFSFSPGLGYVNSLEGKTCFPPFGKMFFYGFWLRHRQRPKVEETRPGCVSLVGEDRGWRKKFVENFTPRKMVQWKRAPGCLGYIGDDILPQLYRDYFINHEIRILIKQSGFNGK